MIRVLIVDDSAFMRRAINRIYDEDPGIEVIGTARDGLEAVELAERLEPDLITLDIEMPKLDGLAALERIMKRCPTRVLMLSSLTSEGSHATLRALRLGAVDFLTKQHSRISIGISELGNELLAKTHALAGSPAKRPSIPTPVAGDGGKPRFRPGQFDLVCIGASTGGPPLLERILPALPADFSAAIIVAQHMPELFTRSITQRLANLCAMPVHHAEDGMSVANRQIHIAPGGHHLHVEKLALARYGIRISDQPASAPFRPSVDCLLSSAAHSAGRRALGIVLTGIGEDGLQGGRVLFNAGGTLLAQDERSSVVYGMPRAVTVHGLSAASLSPDALIETLMTLARPCTRAAG